MDLKNKIVVITGSTKGLGKALAVEFLNEQAKVIINAQSKEELQKVSKEIGAIGYCGDVAKESDMKKLANFAVKKFRKVDVWINNAGTSTGHFPIEKINYKQAHKVMEVNFFGTFYGSRSAMEYMKKQKHGTIINIISIRAITPSPLSSIYSSSKWAVRGFTELLRMALEPENISVIAIYPSGMKTNFFGKTKPINYKNFMEPSFVAKKIIQNLKSEKLRKEMIIEKK